MGDGRERHLAEEFVVVCEYALDRLERKRLVEVLDCMNCGRSLLPNRQRPDAAGGVCVHTLHPYC